MVPVETQRRVLPHQMQNQFMPGYQTQQNTVMMQQPYMMSPAQVQPMQGQMMQSPIMYGTGVTGAMAPQPGYVQTITTTANSNQGAEQQLCCCAAATAALCFCLVCCCK